MKKKSLLSAFLTAIIVGGLILASPLRFGLAQASTGASGIPNQSVPEFTLKYVDYSYDVPPTTTSTTDPYTNKTTTTTIPGYHVENKTIQATIKNNIGASYYNFRYKGHYSEEWRYYPFDPDSPRGYNLYSAYNVPCHASASSYTVILLTFLPKSIPEGGQVDVQVQALFDGFRSSGASVLAPGGATYDFYFTGTTSGWSNTQTITLGETQTPTPLPATTPVPTPDSVPTPIPVPGQSFFFVESNSKVTDLFFNSTSAELSFTVSGESGTAGYVEVTIAKSLVSTVQNVKVYLDGKQLDVEITSADSWILNFNYVHSTHNVRISLSSNAATTTFIGIEYWMWIGVATTIAVLGIGLLLYFRERKH